MPKIKTSRQRLPKGYEVLESTLLDLDQKMKDGMSSSHPAFYYTVNLRANISLVDIPLMQIMVGMP